VIRKAGLGDGLSENSRTEMGLEEEYRAAAPIAWILGIWESRSREGEPRAAAEEQREGAWVRASRDRVEWSRGVRVDEKINLRVVLQNRLPDIFFGQEGDREYYKVDM
jgi:hypothetical protein